MLMLICCETKTLLATNKILAHDKPASALATFTANQIGMLVGACPICLSMFAAPKL
jgi:hypothetical protein